MEVVVDEACSGLKQQVCTPSCPPHGLTFVEALAPSTLEESLQRERNMESDAEPRVGEGGSAAFVPALRKYRNC
jgi:hypothetical protein